MNSLVRDGLSKRAILWAQRNSWRLPRSVRNRKLIVGATSSWENNEIVDDWSRPIVSYDANSAPASEEDRFDESHSGVGTTRMFSMHNPKVTFVVPCFRLAHFLRECVDSILRQSCPEIEVLIMDDRSPDDTGEVTRKILADYPDRPVSYVLNEQNLGNIGNYNKGIQMARGRYVWILSPDDRLRDPDVVEKYVRLMDAHPEVGYVFCAVHRIEGTDDAGVHRRSVYRPEDQILDSRKLVMDIVDSNFELVAASVMIRKECYETVTLFPLDMPHRGDTYVWALIALRYRVAYFSGAMVDYRTHDGSMMTTMARANMARMIEDDIAVLWRIKAEAARQGANEIVTHCWQAIVSAYAQALLGFKSRGQTCALTPAQFESLLARWVPDPAIASTFRSTVAADLYWTGLWKLSRGHLVEARHALVSAIRLHPKLGRRPTR